MSMRHKRYIPNLRNRSRETIAIWMVLLVAISTVTAVLPAPMHHSTEAVSIFVAGLDGAGKFDGSGHHRTAPCHAGFGCTASVLPESTDVLQDPSMSLRRTTPGVQMWRTRFQSPTIKPPIV